MKIQLREMILHSSKKHVQPLNRLLIFETEVLTTLLMYFIVIPQIEHYLINKKTLHGFFLNNDFLWKTWFY